jgi:hypothetical protein
MDRTYNFGHVLLTGIFALTAGMLLGIWDTDSRKSKECRGFVTDIHQAATAACGPACADRIMRQAQDHSDVRQDPGEDAPDFSRFGRPID